VWLGKRSQPILRNLYGGKEENHEELYSGLPVCGPRFEPGIFRINRDGAHPAAVLRN
jgi:hypothetical protein